MAKSWGKTKAPSNNRNNVKPEDVVDIHTFTAEYSTIRLVGPVTSVGTHWITINTKEKGIKDIPKTCLNYNPETEEFDENGCPYCEHGDTRFGPRYYANAIIRELQEAKPAKMFPLMASEKKVVNIGSKDEPFKVKLKEKGSKSWTPIRIISIPASVANSLSEIAKTNRHLKKDKKTGKKTEETFDLADEKFGIDLMINLKKGGAAGFGKYDIQKDRKTPLTEEELDYLYYTLSIAKPESLADANKEWKQLSKKLVSGGDDDDDDEGSTKSKGKKKRDPFEDDDDRPRNKSKKSSSRSSDDDDDDDDDDDLPAKKKRKKSADPFDDLDREISRAKKKKPKPERSTKSKTKKR
jgi:hypothetical protein